MRLYYTADFLCNNFDFFLYYSVFIFILVITKNKFFHTFLRLNLDKIKSHPQFSTLDKSEIANVNKLLKSTAFPQAEKLKQYIKDVFESEAKEYKIKMVNFKTHT